VYGVVISFLYLKLLNILDNGKKVQGLNASNLNQDYMISQLFYSN
jgi:hypothetical protein